MNRDTSQLHRVLMLGTFGMQPKGTMSARAAGIAQSVRQYGIDVRIATVPWDDPASAGHSGSWLGVPVTNTRTVRPLLWPLAVCELIRISGSFNPDLIHLFKPKGFGDLAARYLQRLGTPVVVDMDDWEGTGGWNDALPYNRLQRRLFDWQEQTWPRQADALTVASRALQQLALEYGASTDRILYLPNELTAARLDALSRTGRRDASRPNRPTILLYTRFVEFEPEFLVRILEYLIPHTPGIRLIVAGRSADGRAEERLMMTARSAGLESAITMHGWVDPTGLAQLARDCSVALVPFDDSMLNRAKCSVKLLELLATGIPVVASSVGENREYILRHGGGLLARPGDAKDHANRLLEAVTRPESIRPPDFTQSGDWTQSIESLLRHYQRAIAAGQG